MPRPAPTFRRLRPHPARRLGESDGHRSTWFPRLLAFSLVASLLLGQLGAPESIALAAPPPPSITSPAGGALLSARPILASGTTVPNALVQVYRGSDQVGGGWADGAGRWTLSLGLGSGQHTIMARAMGSDLTWSPFSDPRTFSVDVPPLAPEFTAPSADAQLNTRPVTVRGHAELDATVTLREGNTVLARDLPVVAYEWSVTLDFAEGIHTINAVETDTLGRTSPATARSFTVDLTPPPPPRFTGPAEGAVAPDSTVAVSGTAERNATVRIYEGDTLKGTTTASSAGSWSLTISGLANGAHTLSARAQDAAGNQSIASEPRTFAVDTVAPAVTIATSEPAVFAPGESGTFTGSASDNRAVARVELRWETLTGAHVRTTVATCTGCGAPSATWSDTTTLDPGSYRVIATAIDQAGHRSAPQQRTFIRL